MVDIDGGAVTRVTSLTTNILTVDSVVIDGANIGHADDLDLMTLADRSLTVDGDLTVADGTNDMNIASHDGTNGLKLAGTLVTSSAAELNYLDITALGPKKGGCNIPAGNTILIFNNFASFIHIERFTRYIFGYNVDNTSRFNTIERVNTTIFDFFFIR